jgi:hypothetical protein
MCASPSRNKWGQRGGDAESDSEAASEQEEVARELERQQSYVALLSMLI